MMRRNLMCGLLFMCSLIPMPVTAELSVSTGIRYDRFADRELDEVNGQEWTVPVGAIYAGERFLLRLETAYSLAHVDYAIGAEIANMTDTLLSASYAFPNLPVGLVFGVDLNLPTGRERLSQKEQAAEAGERHDLFEVDNFGEGFNVGGHVGLVKEFGPVTGSLSGLYVRKDAYDPTANVSRDDLDPGDQWVGFGALNWKSLSGLTAEISAAYAHSAPDQVDGRETFQEGDTLVLGGTVRVQRPKFQFGAGVQQTIQARNRELLDAQLAAEPANSNGNQVYGLLDIAYRWSSDLELLVVGDFRWYRASKREHTESGLPFEGRRERTALGPGVSYLFNDHLTCHSIVKFFIMNQARDIRHEQKTAVRGMNVSVGLTYTF